VGSASTSALTIEPTNVKSVDLLCSEVRDNFIIHMKVVDVRIFKIFISSFSNC
jgi:hypothetical protein